MPKFVLPTSQKEKDAILEAVRIWGTYGAKKNKEEFDSTLFGFANLSMDGNANASHEGRCALALASYFGMFSKLSEEDILDPNKKEMRDNMVREYLAKYNETFNLKLEYADRKEMLDQIFDEYDNFSLDNFDFTNKMDCLKMVFIASIETLRDKITTNNREYVDQRYDTDEKRHKFENQIRCINTAVELWNYGITSAFEEYGKNVSDSYYEIVKRNFGGEYDPGIYAEAFSVSNDIAMQLAEDNDELIIKVDDKIIDIANNYDAQKLSDYVKHSTVYMMFAQLDQGTFENKEQRMVMREGTVPTIYDRIFIGGKSLHEHYAEQFPQNANTPDTEWMSDFFVKEYDSGKLPIDMLNMSFSVNGTPLYSIKPIFRGEDRFIEANNAHRENMANHHNAILEKFSKKIDAVYNSDMYKTKMAEQYVKDRQEKERGKSTYEQALIFDKSKIVEREVFKQLKAKYGLTNEQNTRIDQFTVAMNLSKDSNSFKGYYRNNIHNLMCDLFGDKLLTMGNADGLNFTEAITLVDKCINSNLRRTKTYYEPFAGFSNELDIIKDELYERAYDRHIQKVSGNKDISCSQEDLKSDDRRQTIESLKNDATLEEKKNDTEHILKNYASAMKLKQSRKWHYFIFHFINRYYEDKAIKQIEEAAYKSLGEEGQVTKEQKDALKARIDSWGSMIGERSASQDEKLNNYVERATHTEIECGKNLSLEMKTVENLTDELSNIAVEQDGIKISDKPVASHRNPFPPEQIHQSVVNKEQVRSQDDPVKQSQVSTNKDKIV